MGDDQAVQADDLDGDAAGQLGGAAEAGVVSAAPRRGRARYHVHEREEARPLHAQQHPDRRSEGMLVCAWLILFVWEELDQVGLFCEGGRRWW